MNVSAWSIRNPIPAVLLFVILLPVYVEPSLHRIYAEEMGIDMGDALLAAFGCNFAITLIILLAPRMLDGSAARRRLSSRSCWRSAGCVMVSSGGTKRLPGLFPGRRRAVPPAAGR